MEEGIVSNSHCLKEGSPFFLTKLRPLGEKVGHGQPSMAE